jgi:hypothetical protein
MLVTIFNILNAVVMMRNCECENVDEGIRMFMESNPHIETGTFNALCLEGRKTTSVIFEIHKKLTFTDMIPHPSICKEMDVGSFINKFHLYMTMCSFTKDGVTATIGPMRIVADLITLLTMGEYDEVIFDVEDFGKVKVSTGTSFTINFTKEL